MSDFDYQPAPNATPVHQPRVKTAQFGDGYRQDTPDGINNNLASWNLTFNRARAEIEAIAAFFTSKGGVERFTWTPSGRSEVLVICPEWTDPIIGVNVGTISCRFQEVPA
jgi:phage-related protein